MPCRSSGSAVHSCTPCSTVVSGVEYSLWAMPRPAVMTLTPPGRTVCRAPVESVCAIAPSSSHETVWSPVCGCGGTSIPGPSPIAVGPNASAKHHAPIMWRCLLGRLRSTGSARGPPSGTSRGSSSSTPAAIASSMHDRSAPCTSSASSLLMPQR